MSDNGHYRILVIDDDPTIHRIFRKILETRREKRLPADTGFGSGWFSVDSAYQGPEGLDCVKQALKDNRPYSVVLLDIFMPPGPDGIQTAKHIWEVDAAAQIVFCTAQSDVLRGDIVREFSPRSPFVLLRKPFEKLEVLQLVNFLCERRDRERKLRQHQEHLEERVEQRTEELNERVRELNCLHGVSRLLESPDLSVEDICRKTAELVPSSWKHPQATAARIILEGKAFQTDNFRETGFKLAAPIMVDDEFVGALEVCYLQDQSPGDVDPFLEEERGLIESIVEQLGKVVERSRYESQVRSLNQQIEFVLGATRTRLNIVDSQYRIRYVDPHTKEFYGNPTGKKCYKYFGGHDGPCPGCGLIMAVKTKRSATSEQVLPKEDNRPVQVTSIPFRNDKGEWLYAEVNVDISERKRMERDLAQSQRLEAIGHLAAGIAHEINTPTQYIGDNVRFLDESFRGLDALFRAFDRLLEAARNGGPTDELIPDIEAALKDADLEYLTEEIPQAIGQSLEGVDRVASIVRAMKDFSHPGGEEKQTVDLNAAIESTLTVSRNEWKYVADMVTDFDRRLPDVPCLSMEFNQIILNLVVNAAQAIAQVVGDGSQDKGTITVSTHLRGDWAEIRIADTGTGIPEEIRSKVFDHFFTTKTVGKGTGQGLSIAHAIIVEKHGGTIRFETEVGKGTIFIIRLPIVEPAAADDTLEHEHAKSPNDNSYPNGGISSGREEVSQ